MLGRIRDTVGDVAETIKRVFKGPKVHSAKGLFFRDPEYKTVSWLTAETKGDVLISQPSTVQQSLLVSVSAINPDMKFVAKSFVETGEVFRAEASLVSVALAWSGIVTSADIPGLNSPQMKRVDEYFTTFKTKSFGLPPFDIKHGKTYKLATRISVPACYRSLERAMLVPILLRSEDLEGVSKSLMMRYNLRLVKETGENIKNLEIIGLYQIPKKGLRSVKHDTTTGLLKIIVGPEAQNSPYCNVVVARKKSNSAIVSCRVDED
ncbi:MAG: hypothetical protein FWG02_04370 [Holophagaceae bacterium]|nr:hypothetical protein [Holophagaceae bacterium]